MSRKDLFKCELLLHTVKLANSLDYAVVLVFHAFRGICASIQCAIHSTNPSASYRDEIM